MKIKVVKFSLDLGVMKTKIALIIVKETVSSGLDGMTSNDLLRAQADIEKRFPFFSAKRPYNKQLINLVRSVITGKYIKASV